MDNINIDLIRGHMDTIILATLSSEPKYGLQILNQVKELSHDLYSLKQPTLYSCLKRLEKQGYVESFPGELSLGGKRVYYKITPSGDDFLKSDQKQWEFSRTIIDRLLSDKIFDPKTDEKPFEPSDFRPLTKRSVENEETEVKEIVKEIEVVKEVIKYVEVPKEVIKYVNVPVEVIKEIPKEVIKEVIVEKYVPYPTTSSNLATAKNNGKVAITYGEKEEGRKFINYINIFDEIYSNKYHNTNTVTIQNETKSEDYHIDMNFDKLKDYISKENLNINLKPYVKSNTTEYYSNKYFFVNRAIRDSGIIVAILALTILLSTYFFTPLSTRFSVNWLIVFSVVIALIPIFTVINFFIKPDRRKSLDINFGYYTLFSIIFFLIASVFAIILGFFVFQADIRNLSTLIVPILLPILLFAMAPISIVIYAILVKTNRYNLV